MSEPTMTEAGRALLDELVGALANAARGHPVVQGPAAEAHFTPDILAIEDEARAAERERIAAAVEALDYRMVEWWHPDGQSYSLHQVVTWSEVLDVIRAGAARRLDEAVGR